MRRTVLLAATMALAILAASAMALLVVEESAEAAFPGENGRIAFASDRNTAAFPNPEADRELYTMKPDGTGVKRLTNNAAEDEDPEYSASGKKIAFSRGQFNRAGIYTMNADGSGVRKLTDNETYEPAWSPNGKKIAFTRFNNGGDSVFGEIYTMNADGSGLKRIVDGCFSDQCFKLYGSPDWSPDGKKIALEGAEFLPCDGDAAKSIYTVNPDGSGLKRITHTGRRVCYPPDFSPDWSPNAKKIVFYSPGPAGGILTVNRDGSGEKMIYSSNRFDEEESNDPAWSPDGKRIAFVHFGCNYGDGGRPVSCVGPGAGVYTINASDGSERRRLTDTPAYESSLDWQAQPASEPASGFCTITGTRGDDALRGTSGSDVICGRGGGDAISGLGGNDVLRGGPGVDAIEGGWGSDELYGEKGVDSLDATDGVRRNDSMNGGGGTDACRGDRGDTKTNCG
jgi:TolB protein